MAEELKARACLKDIKPYKPGKPIEEVQRELGIFDVIKLASNENPLGPAPKAQEAIYDAAGRVSLYPDGNCFSLKRSLSEKLNIGEEYLIIGNGSDEILKFLAETYLSEGDETIAAAPTFSEYTFVTKLMGGRVIEVPLDDEYCHDLESMQDAVNKKTKIIFICNPNNPTGTIVKKKEFEKFLNAVPKNVLVVFDEAYHEYVESTEYPDGLSYIREGRENIIVLRTFSKFYGLAGLRVGYGIADPQLLSWVSRVKEPFNVNLLAQEAACRALEDEDFCVRTYTTNSEGKKYLYSELEKIGLKYIPTEANFIMLDTGINCRKVFDALLRKGVIVRTGDIFGMDTWLRVTVGTLEQNERFTGALKDVLQELRKSP